MQAIILAAGVGKRLSAVNGGLPKCYLKLNGETILERHLRLFRSRGIKDIIIVTGFQKGRIESDFSGRGITFAFNPFYETSNVLTSFWIGQRYLTSEFVFLHADTVFDEPIFDGLLRSTGSSVLSVDFHECGEEEMKVRVLNNRVMEINKTMRPESANGEFIGVAKFSSAALTAIRAEAELCLSEKHFDKFFEFALERLIRKEALEVECSPVGGHAWSEIDFPEDYEHAKRSLAGSK